MKFLHSPSSSSSSTTDTRPDYTAARCIPAILRRLPCFNSLPTFTLDDRTHQSYENHEFVELYSANKLKGNPGIVAKLMGLDSMPAGSSIDHELRQLKLQKKGNSVLEPPCFVELENDKFIILSFEGDGKDKELQLHSSNSRKRSNAINKTNQEFSICQSPEKNYKVTSACKLPNLGKNSEKLGEAESDSDNSSPVSVLEFPDHQEASCSGKADLKSKNSNSRRKLRGDLDKNAPSPPSSPRSSCSSSVDDGEESSRRTGKEYTGLEKKKFLIGDFKGIWEEICKMAERDLMDSSRVQMERWKGEDFEEIGVCFELQILDQLILELFTMT